MLLKKRTRRVCCPDDSCSSSRVMNTTTTTNNNNNNQNEGNALSFSLSSLSLSLSEEQEREKASSFFLYARVDLFLSLSLFFSGRVSKLLFRVTNETLTTQFASFIKGKKITSKPHRENRRAFKAPRKEFFVAPLLRRRRIRIRRKGVFLGVLFNPFLSETRFSRRSRGERNHHSSLQSLCSFVF